MLYVLCIHVWYACTVECINVHSFMNTCMRVLAGWWWTGGTDERRGGGEVRVVWIDLNRQSSV